MNAGSPTTSESVKASLLVTAQTVDAFAALSGDYNPLHMDVEFARSAGFRGRVVHGLVAATLVSQLIGTKLPGPGALWLSQEFRWLAPVFIGDTIEVELKKVKSSLGTHTISVEVAVRNQDGKPVMEGNGVVKVLEQRTATRNLPVAERSALVTGGSHVIGAEVASALAHAGARVTVLYRSRAQEVIDLCARLTDAGGKAVAAKGDLLDFRSIETVVDHASETFGRPVDLLVNCAGTTYRPKPFLETDWQAFQQQIDVRLRGMVHCCQATLPGMIASGSGCIVNIGSSYAWGVPPAQWTGFASAAAALQAATRCLAAEFGPKGVRVNMVSPGMTNGSASGVTDRIQKVQAMQTPLRRLAETSEVAAAVLFLCSDHSNGITGADIPVCAGSVM